MLPLRMINTNMTRLSFSGWTNLYRTVSLQETVDRNVIQHLTHIEDLVITRFAPGAQQALTTLKGFSSYLSGHANAPINVTVKVDGAPSIVAGPDPTDGQFFIGTKGAFAKTPRIAKTPADLQRLYGAVPGLLDTMTVAFHALKGLNFTKILQGDVLFTPAIKETQTIDGESYLTFKPNTIVYGVPLNSIFGQQLAAAKFGVCFHTTYDGASFQTLRASSGADTATLRAGASVALISSRYQDVSGTLTFTASESQALAALITNITTRTRNLSQNAFLRDLKDVPLLQAEFMIFQNALVRGGESITLTPVLFATRFIGHLASRAGAEASKRTTLKGKDAITGKYDVLRDLVTDHESALVEVLAWQQAVAEAKAFIMEKLNQHGSLGTFYTTSSGLVRGQHEGFVAVDKTGNFVKLVNRGEFSRMNLTQGRFRT